MGAEERRTLRQELLFWHRRIYEEGLVVWSQGNISCRMTNRERILIKASGIHYEDLTPDHMVEVSIPDGECSGRFKPSTDTSSHRVVYQEFDFINAIVHTHSTFCTAFAACGKPIPVALTAMADEFGDLIPCSQYCEIGGEEVGREVVGLLGDAGAVLIRNHGLFTVGRTLEEAVKRAVMSEDCARTTWHATRTREYILLTQDQIDACHKRYKGGGYGQ